MNAKDPELVERFIELRAAKLSFDKIAETLHVTKPTLIEWSRIYHHQISNLRTLRKEALADKHKLSSEHCLEQLGNLLQRLSQELEKRNLDDIPTHKLALLLPILQTHAAKLLGPLQLSTSVPADAPPQDQFPDPVITWEI